MKKTIIILLLTALSPGFIAKTQAAVTSWQCELFQAFLNKDMNKWKTVMLSAESKLINSKDTKEIFDLAHAFYGYTGYLLSIKDNAMAAVYQKKLDLYILKLENLHYKTSRVMALQSASSAFKMAINPMSMMSEGPKLLSHINKSIENDPNCPYALFEQGNAYFHRPKSFGGSLSKAIECYKKAVANYKNDLECDWYFINILSQLEESYRKSSLLKEADEIKVQVEKLSKRS